MMPIRTQITIPSLVRIKVGALDRLGRAVAAGREETPPQSPSQGWARQKARPSPC